MRMAGAWAAVAPVLLCGSMATAQQCYYSEIEEGCDTERLGGQSGVVQGQSIGSAIGSVVGARLDTGPDVSSQDGGGASNTSYWVSAGASSFAGDTEGWQREAVGGVDFYLGDTALAGLFVGAGDSRRATDTTPFDTEVSATVAGAYFARLYGESTILHFYVGGGRADYTADNAEVDADRLMAGVDLSWEVDQTRAVFVPFGKLLMSSDDVPAYFGDSGFHDAATIVGTSVTAGGRWEFKEPLGQTALLPYVSLGVDYLRIDPDNTLTVQEAISPRVEAGLAGPLGEGILALDLHAAKADEGTSDFGGVLTYSFGF